MCSLRLPTPVSFPTVIIHTSSGTSLSPATKKRNRAGTGRTEEHPGKADTAREDGVIG